MEKISLKNLNCDETYLNENKNKNIFFIDGYPNSDEKNISDVRIACSVESAALHNPNLMVFYTFTTFNPNISFQKTPLSHALNDYKNIKLRFLNLETFLKNSSLEKWLEKEPYWTYSAIEVAEVLGMVLLRKFGGFYLNPGVLTLKPYDDLKSKHFVCSKFRSKVQSSIIRLDNDDFGFKIINEFFRLITYAFDHIPKGEKIDEILLNPNHLYFTANSSFVPTPSDVLNKIIQKICKGKIVDDKFLKRCGKFSILPIAECPPNANWQKFLKVGNSKRILRKIRQSHFFNVHWSKSFDIKRENALREISRQNCPKVFELVQNSSNDQ